MDVFRPWATDRKLASIGPGLHWYSVRQVQVGLLVAYIYVAYQGALKWNNLMTDEKMVPDRDHFKQHHETESAQYLDELIHCPVVGQNMPSCSHDKRALM